MNIQTIQKNATAYAKSDAQRAQLAAAFGDAMRAIIKEAGDPDAQAAAWNDARKVWCNAYGGEAGAQRIAFMRICKAAGVTRPANSKGSPGKGGHNKGKASSAAKKAPASVTKASPATAADPETTAFVALCLEHRAEVAAFLASLAEKAAKPAKVAKRAPVIKPKASYQDARDAA